MAPSSGDADARADRDVDHVVRVARELPPAARRALLRAVLAAVERRSAPLADLAPARLSSEAEILPAEEASARLESLIRRASQAGPQAPLVRLDADEDYAVLTSGERWWQLSDRVDELTLALHVLATTVARELGTTELERLAQELETDA